MLVLETILTVSSASPATRQAGGSRIAPPIFPPPWSASVPLVSWHVDSGVALAVLVRPCTSQPQLGWRRMVRVTQTDPESLVHPVGLRALVLCEYSPAGSIRRLRGVAGGGGVADVHAAVR